MRKIISLTIAMICCGVCAAKSPKTPVDYVNPLMGTMSKYELSTGNTYPAIARPWGAHFWTPQTGNMGNGWTYVYTADKIRGFKQTHQPSPWINDYGQFSIMPTTSKRFDEKSRASWFSHKAETATPYYYGVYLADHDTYVEMTPTEHACAFRINYPKTVMSYLVIDAFDKGSSVSVDGNRITGYSVRNSGGVPDNFKNWFVVECDRQFDTVAVVSGDHAMAIVGFKDTGTEVNLKVASSFVSANQALENLKEVSGRGFDEIKEEGRQVWNDVLSRIEIEDDDIDNKRTFYSCLYRSVLFPRDLSEIDASGRRIHYSPHDGKIHDGYFFTDTGFWDTFRSLFALVDLVYPEMASKMQEGLVNCYLESGFLPEWASPGHRGCMVGNNSASVVAEAYLKGIRGYNIEKLWEAVKSGAHSVHPNISTTGRVGWQYYDSLGYVPCDVKIGETAARTLEYAYDDWCIWKLGKELGKAESEIAPYAKAAMNYRNVFSDKDKLMRGRRLDGTFRENFNMYKWGGDFTEGNSLHYTWSVFHDPAGLANLMGGEDVFARMLDTIFSVPPIFDESAYGGMIHEIREMQVMDMGNYAHGNQPIQHVAYLYNWCGQPWKAQSHVRNIMDRLYSATPDGYCGDEDNGQTSAWYVFSALGFYPVCPASCQYAMGSPLFKKATVHLPGGKNLIFEAPENSNENIYIEKVLVNGTLYNRNYFDHSLLTGGAKVEYTMSQHPCTERGTEKESAPYSFSKQY